MLKFPLQNPELEISASTEMQISGAAGGEWPSSMFDGLLSFLAADWQYHSSMKR